MPLRSLIALLVLTVLAGLIGTPTPGASHERAVHLAEVDESPEPLPMRPDGRS